MNKLQKLYSDFLAMISDDTATVAVAGYEYELYSETAGEYWMSREAAEGERVVLEEIADVLGPEDVFWDVGANVGLYSCLAAQICDAVVAVEAFPANAERVRENLALNDTEGDVYEAALGDEPGEIELSIQGDEVGLTKHSTEGDFEETVTVTRETGDRLIERGARPPTVLKVDVEGDEARVLRGLEGALADTVEHAYVEMHDERMRERGDEPADVVDMLASAGFEAERMDEQPGMLRAVKED